MELRVYILCIILRFNFPNISGVYAINLFVNLVKTRNEPVRNLKNEKYKDAKPDFGGRLTHRNAQHEKSHRRDTKDSEHLTAALLGSPRVDESGKGVEQKVLEHHL